MTVIGIFPTYINHTTDVNEWMIYFRDYYGVASVQVSLHIQTCTDNLLISTSEALVLFISQCWVLSDLEAGNTRQNTEYIIAERHNTS